MSDTHQPDDSVSRDSLGGHAGPVLTIEETPTIKRDMLDKQGHPAVLDELPARLPAVPRQEDDIANLLFDDFCDRLRQGEDVSIADYQSRYPDQQESLAKLARQQQF